MFVIIHSIIQRVQNKFHRFHKKFNMNKQHMKYVIDLRTNYILIEKKHFKYIVVEVKEKVVIKVQTHKITCIYNI